MTRRISIRLKPMQRRKFQRLVKKTTDARVRLRYLIILKYDEGKGCTTIARELCCANTTPPRVAHRFLQWGEVGLVDGRCENGTVKADERCYAVLVKLLQGTPRDWGWARTTWTRELLAKQVKAETGTALSTGTISAMLHALGARKGRPKPTVSCPWSKRKREARLREIHRILETLPADEVAVWEDEVDIDLNPKIGPDWMLPGTQKTVQTPGKNEKQYIAGALNAQTGDVHYVEGPRKRSALFVQLLFFLANVCYPKAKRIHVVLDNYIIHTSKITRKAVEQLGGRIVLHFLPPYCPDENPIEMLWRQVHDNVTRNHRCENMEALMKEVRDFLHAASPYPGSQPSLRRTS